MSCNVFFCLILERHSLPHLPFEEQKESGVGWSPLSMMVAATPPHQVRPERMWVSEYKQFVGQGCREKGAAGQHSKDTANVFHKDKFSGAAGRVSSLVWSPWVSSSSRFPSSWHLSQCYRPPPPQSCCSLEVVRASWLIVWAAGGWSQHRQSNRNIHWRSHWEWKGAVVSGGVFLLNLEKKKTPTNAQSKTCTWSCFHSATELHHQMTPRFAPPVLLPEKTYK